MYDTDTALKVSHAVNVTVCLALGSVLVVDAARSRAIAWLPRLAIGLLIFMYFSGFDMLWAVAWPLLAATFPDGRFVPRWLVVPVAAYAIFGLADELTGGWATDQSWGPMLNMASGLFLAAPVYRYMRRATTAERKAVRWVIVGILLTFAWFQAVWAGFGQIGESPWSSVFANLAMLPLLACLVIGLVAADWLAVDPLLHAVITAYVVVPVLALAYALTGGWPGAVAVAVLTIPAFWLGQRVAGWIVYRGRPSPAKATADLLGRLNARDPATSVPEVVLEVTKANLYLDHGSIDGDWFAPVGAPTGEAAVEATAFPITYRGEDVAVLHLVPRRGETAFTPRDRSVIDALVTHAAPALHGAQVLAHLQDSRALIVSAREEERRRLRRELHDDLGPTLSGLALSAAALARSTGSPEASVLHEDIAHAVRQSRELAYDLRPPVLDDHGLIAAIADRTRGEGSLVVHLDAPDGVDRDLPAAVDLSALRIVVEAVANTRKHARARRVDIRLRRTAAELIIEIHDDGTGLPADVRVGIGMHSIAERAAEIGGTARYDRTATGTRLLVSLPVDTDPSEGT